MTLSQQIIFTVALSADYGNAVPEGSSVRCELSLSVTSELQKCSKGKEILLKIAGPPPPPEPPVSDHLS